MTDTLRRACLTAATGLGLCLTLLPAGQAQAQARTQAPVRVPCNDVAALKTAINNANTSGGSIVLASRCVYSLTEADNADDGLPEITGNVRISGGERTTIQRSPSATGGFRIFHVQQSGSLSLDSVTVRGGDAAGTRGGRQRRWPLQRPRKTHPDRRDGQGQQSRLPRRRESGTTWEHSP